MIDLTSLINCLKRDIMILAILHNHLNSRNKIAKQIGKPSQMLENYRSRKNKRSKNKRSKNKRRKLKRMRADLF